MQFTSLDLSTNCLIPATAIPQKSHPSAVFTQKPPCYRLSMRRFEDLTPTVVDASSPRPFAGPSLSGPLIQTGIGCNRTAACRTASCGQPSRLNRSQMRPSTSAYSISGSLGALCDNAEASACPSRIVLLAPPEAVSPLLRVLEDSLSRGGEMSVRCAQSHMGQDTQLQDSRMQSSAKSLSGDDMFPRGLKSGMWVVGFLRWPAERRHSDTANSLAPRPKTGTQFMIALPDRCHNSLDPRCGEGYAS
jgi:hypothetical protein